jgi:hypothetical protein
MSEVFGREIDLELSVEPIVEIFVCDEEAMFHGEEAPFKSAFSEDAVVIGHVGVVLFIAKVFAFTEGAVRPDDEVIVGGEADGFNHDVVSRLR